MQPPHDELPPATPRKSVCSALIDRGKDLFDALYDKVWTPREATYHTLPMRVFTTIWRIVEITINGTINNNIPMHAAALTYYALMALAPFVMLVLTIFGIVMNVQGEEAVRIMQERLAETMQLVLPTPADTIVPVIGGNPEDVQAIGTLAPQLEEFSGMLLKNTMANSGSTGTIGTLILVVLAVFMIARIEDAYNLIWNVRNRRSWARRFWVYFLFLVLGGAVSAVAMSVLSVSAIFKRLAQSTSEVSVYAAGIPGGEFFFNMMTSIVPLLIAFAIMTLLFASLNRYLPNVGVNWRPALLGGGIVAISFIGCGKAASLFVSKISEFNSIYGNLSVIFILMFGLYLSWMFLLIGGQISYAAQNAGFFKNINRKWAELSPRAKQEAFFASLFAVYERCSREEKGLTLEELGNVLCIPANLASECTSTLIDLKLLVTLSTEMDEGGRTRYNTAGTVGKLTIAELRRRFDNLRMPIELGGNARLQAALARFSASFAACEDSTTFETLLADCEKESALA